MHTNKEIVTTIYLQKSEVEEAILNYAGCKWANSIDFETLDSGSSGKKELWRVVITKRENTES